MRSGVTRRETRGGPATWGASLARQTRERPIRTVALTLGTGFILGGGLFSPLTVRLLGAGLRLGVRFALLPMVAEGLGALAERAFTQRGEIVDDSPKPSSDPKKRRHAHEAQ
jgi:hypothetical protein